MNRPAPETSVIEPSDHDLLYQTSRGDERAARALWERFAPKLHAVARTMLRRHGADAAAADAVQTVFCAVTRLDRATAAQINDAAAWLVSCTRRAALNHVRTESRQQARAHANRTAAPPSPSLAQSARLADSAIPSELGAPGFIEPPGTSDTTLTRAVDALPEHLRELIVLKHVGGLTFDQMARALDENRNTLASRYRSAIDALRRALTGDAPVRRQEIGHVHAD